MKMKKIATMLLTSMVTSAFLTTSAFAWDGPTHRRLTEIGISPYQYQLTPTYFQTLCQMSVQTDDIENDPIYIYSAGGPMQVMSTRYGHFYNPSNNQNYLGVSDENNALARFERHGSAAMNHYTTGDTNIAMLELGMAIHYLEDMTCPVHIYGLQLQKYHNGLESEANTLVNQVSPVYNSNYSNFNTSNFYNYCRDFGLDTARQTQGWADRLVTGNYSTADASRTMLPIAQQRVYAFMTAFFREAANRLNRQ